ncbi:MAG TPA: type II toxin-antitoxin system PemK/MazF family toxin [Thermoanaerobaculia bacterium]|nr:type II toxin-antitoxin system PemK/MazF family toxin [Thermoanaerobaculia bacterium]
MPFRFYRRPLTSRGRFYPTRVRCHFDGQDGSIVLDQIRTVDIARLVKKLGRIEPATLRAVLTVQGQIFAEWGTWRSPPSFRRLWVRPGYRRSMLIRAKMCAAEPPTVT